MAKMTEEQIYSAARHRVRQKKDFYNHLAVYVVVNAALVIIWYLTGHGYPWFVWALLGWGIGILFHGLDVFVFNKQSAWEQREIEKEAERLRKNSSE